MSVASLLAQNNYDLQCRSLTTGGDHPTTNTIQIGQGASASGSDSIAIGISASAESANSMAIGGAAQAVAGNNVSLGQNSRALQEQDISIGYTAGGVDNTETGILRLAGIPTPVASSAAVTLSVPIVVNGALLWVKASTTA